MTAVSSHLPAWKQFRNNQYENRMYARCLYVLAIAIFAAHHQHIYVSLVNSNGSNHEAL
jgi:amino acid permease